MGTRGIVGFTLDGEDKLTYNHYDSYPDSLGEDMVDFVRNMDAAAVKKQVQKLILVQEDGADPTPEQIEKLNHYCNPNVGARLSDARSNPPINWYQLLRETQGDPAAILEAGYMVDSRTFILDSLFCEYAYIINFDTNMLEFYKGFQREPGEGRFQYPNSATHEYYPCTLVGEYPLDNVPDNWKQECFPEDEDD